ncbi:MAG: FlgD immunoglobulin-like domain containing protein [Candidatus Eisenbacteria bacterium]
MKRPFVPLALLLLSFLFPCELRAGYDRWTAEGGPFGGRVEAILDLPGGGGLLVGTEAGGIFRREGGRWVRRNDGLLLLDVCALEANPADADTVFAGTSGAGVYRSANGGRSWFPANTGLTNLAIRDLAHLPGGAGLLAATAGGGVFRTLDAGLHWTPSNPGLGNVYVRSLAFAPSDPSVVYAGTDGGVYRSVNGGLTWASRTAGLPASPIEEIAVDPVDEDRAYAGTYGAGVFRTLSGGLSWSAAVAGMGAVYVEGIEIREDRPDTLWAATRSGLFESFDGGSLWAARNAGLADTVLLAVEIAGETLAVGSYWGGVAFSPAPAFGWTAMNDGLANRFVWEIALSPWDGGVLYAASYGGVSVSADTGWTWSDASGGLGEFDVRSVAPSPGEPNKVLAGFFYGGVFRSLDGGGSWAPSSGGLPAGATVTVLRHRPGDGSRVLCGTYSGMYASADGGATWVSSWSGFGRKKVWGAATVATAPDLVYAGTYENGLFKSVDFGATWDSVPLPDPFVRAVAVDPTDTSVVYAGGYYTQGGLGGVYKSTDGGASWTAKNSGLLNESVWCLQVDPYEPSRILAATAAGVFESRNGADSWSGVNVGLQAKDVRWVVLAGERLVAGVYGGSAPWYEGAVVSVASSGPARAPFRIVAAPNPFNPSTVLRLPPVPGKVRVGIYDIAGRLVRRLESGGAGEEEALFPWDGRDGSGRNVSSGVYFGVAETAFGTARARIVLVR